MSSTRVHQPIRTYTHNLCERIPATDKTPYGCYKYESSLNNLPGGLFHFVRGGYTYVPTLHGLSADFIRSLKEVAVCTANSAMPNRPFLNSPNLYEVELINTGREALRQGDRFTVQLPSRTDVVAQREVTGDPGYDLSVNKDIWGGLLATRKVDCDFGGDPVEEVVQAIKTERDFDAFELVSPYTPQSILSMMTLVANGADYQEISDELRLSAARAVNEDYNGDLVGAIAEDESVKKYLRTVIRHAVNIVDAVQGFAAGQVVRSCSGYNFSTVKTGEKFVAQLNLNRWLS
ncbi:hypothetical protein WMY93_031096 [Mugilogobius chulae]|uniref:Uncharacterized protein n=1 Tax=Mugilogobius chulae TaxID=88201 RepID=A0AAW0MGZ1_9GOBI